jgi:hypothetical protein
MSDSIQQPDDAIPTNQDQPDTPASATPSGKEEVPVEPATTATTLPGKARLRDLEFDEKERFCHRDKSERTRASLKPLMDSIVSENGVQVPVEYVVLERIKTVVRGHRRVQSCLYLVEDGVPGFHLDMEILANEVVGATEGDLILRSILDNENRLSLKGMGRINAIKLLVEMGIDDKRAALALNVSLQTYKREKLLAIYPWMLEFINFNKIGATAGCVLLDEAIKVGWVSEFQSEISAYFAEREKELEELERLQIEKTGKGLKTADKYLKKFLRADLLAQWVSQIRKKEPLARSVEWNFAAGFEMKKEELYLGGKKIDLKELPAQEVAQVVGKLGLVVKDLGRYAKKRYELEQLAGENTSEGEVMDVNLLRALGLGSIAGELTEEARRAAEEQKETENESGAEDQPDDKNQGE